MTYNLDYLKNILPKRPKNSHKGTFGNVLNIAGSGFYTGAAYFSSVAPLKAGCGKVTLASVQNVLRAVSSLIPDVILMPIENINRQNITNFQAISIGCGLSTGKASVRLFERMLKLLKNIQIPVVIDADGLNVLAGLNKYNLPSNLILTPHPKEMSGLMGETVENILKQPEWWAKKCSEKYSCTTILKLHNTVVADNKNNLYINNTGNTALSHGGSGDVLCGIIAGFLAQGLGCFDASVLGVYLHGLASEIASEELTEYSVLASDLLNYIHKAIKTLI